MARNMSFSLTTQQIQNRTKTVTRRKGWAFLRPGDRVWACRKCMGLKPGERIERLALLEVVIVLAEPLALTTMVESGRAYNMLTVRGANEVGRSGGPIFSVDGRLVGVASTSTSQPWLVVLGRGLSGAGSERAETVSGGTSDYVPPSGLWSLWSR